jgi:phage pi2 protein 07
MNGPSGMQFYPAQALNKWNFRSKTTRNMYGQKKANQKHRK